MAGLGPATHDLPVPEYRKVLDEAVILGRCLTMHDRSPRRFRQSQ